MPFFTTTDAGELVVAYGPSVKLTPTDFIESVHFCYDFSTTRAGPIKLEIAIQLSNKMVTVKIQLADAATYASAETQTEMVDKIYEEFRRLAGQPSHTGGAELQSPLDTKFTTVTKNGMFRCEPDPTEERFFIHRVTYYNMRAMTNIRYGSCATLSSREKRFVFNVKIGPSWCDIYITVDMAVTHLEVIIEIGELSDIFPFDREAESRRMSNHVYNFSWDNIVNMVRRAMTNESRRLVGMAELERRFMSVENRRAPSPVREDLPTFPPGA